MVFFHLFYAPACHQPHVKPTTRLVTGQGLLSSPVMGGVVGSAVASCVCMFGSGVTEV